MTKIYFCILMLVTPTIATALAFDNYQYGADILKCQEYITFTRANSTIPTAIRLQYRMSGDLVSNRYICDHNVLSARATYKCLHELTSDHFIVVNLTPTSTQQDPRITIDFFNTKDTLPILYITTLCEIARP